MPSQRLANPFAYDESAAPYGASPTSPKGNPLSAAARPSATYSTTPSQSLPAPGFTNALAAGYGATLKSILPIDFEGRTNQQLARNRTGLLATDDDSTPSPSPLVAAATSVKPVTPPSQNPLSAAAQPERADTSIPGVSRVNQPGQSPIFTNVGASGAPASPSPLVAGVTQSPDVMGILSRESKIRSEMTPLRDQVAFNAGTGGLPLIRKTGTDEIVRDMLTGGNTRDRQNALSYMASREDAANRQTDPLAAAQRQQTIAQTGLTQNQLMAGVQLQQLQQRYLAETDPAKQQAMADQLMALQGREPSNHYSTNLVHGVKTKDNMGNETVSDPISLTTDLRTGQTMAQPLVRQANTITTGGVVNGYRFKGGDPNMESNWEKVR